MRKKFRKNFFQNPLEAVFFIEIKTWAEVSFLQPFMAENRQVYHIKIQILGKNAFKWDLEGKIEIKQEYEAYIVFDFDKSKKFQKHVALKI